MRDRTVGMDQMIADAVEDGQFADLPGKGKPLEIDTSPDAVVKGILKQANVSMTPEWITLAMEIDRLLDEGEQALAVYAAEHAAARARLLEDDSPPAGEKDAPPAPASTSGLWRWCRELARRWLEPRPSPLAAEARRAEALALFHQRWDHALVRRAAALHECNRKIRRFNQIVPVDNRQRRPLLVQEQLDRFAQQFPRIERSAAGGLQLTRGAIPSALLTPPPAEGDAVPRARDPLQAIALQRMRQGARRPPPIG